MPGDHRAAKLRSHTAYLPGFVQVDVKYLPQMADEDRRRYLFVAIDRATRCAFDRLCQALGIEHRLTPPRHPQTNGMAERFNGRIADLLRTHPFRSSEDLEQTLHRYVTLYSHHLPQQALNARTPAQALQDWYASHPALFHRRPNNRPGRDI